jgi:hypothetical protein
MKKSEAKKYRDTVHLNKYETQICTIVAIYVTISPLANRNMSTFQGHQITEIADILNRLIQPKLFHLATAAV